MLMVINTYRPLTNSVFKIINMKERLENESNLKITGYVNNSNFLRSTTVKDMILSNHILSEVSQLTNVSVKYVSGVKAIIDQLPSNILGERIVLDLFLRKNWL